MFMYLEDVDVAARATVMGWTSYFVPDAVAYHMGSASTGGGTGKSRYAFYMTYRNNFGMLVKNLPWSDPAEDHDPGSRRRTTARSAACCGRVNDGLPARSSGAAWSAS